MNEKQARKKYPIQLVLLNSLIIAFYLENVSVRKKQSLEDFRGSKTERNFKRENEREREREREKRCNCKRERRKETHKIRS